ncbi:ExeM/NucH family extracellular endonuclease [Aliikangiella maris]|uniref:ExeM/NucH family extracellular endonuclease n=2 Tax=Aliikangiella maris TaxID=3162458 RepID=A0ABV3MRZ5_9GAMM
MKFSLITSLVLGALGSTTLTAAPQDLFISEYIEGSSNNKALEIANLSGSSIDLSHYQIRMYFNGKTTAGLSINLSGTLPSGEVYVLAHASANSSILAVADQTQGSGWFNGDDAVVLTRGNAVIDSIGQIGVDPGSQWGSGLTSTQNNTLRRSLNISAADTDPSDTYSPEAQWIGYDTDNSDNLGMLEEDDTGSNPSESQCGDDATYIHQIQGAGEVTPMSGEEVTIEGIVVGDFNGSNALNGFFIQEEASDYDNDELTSEGMFVYYPNGEVTVQDGDQVRITGRVGEYRDMTQLSNVTNLKVCATNLSATPLSILLPFTQRENNEAIEGMKVIFEQTLTVSENYNLGRYGELILSNGRLYNPTNVVAPGEAAVAMQNANNLNQIILDDASTRQNPWVIPYPQPELTAFNTVRGGDTVFGLTGIMHQAFGAYRIQATQQPDFIPTNSRTTQPALNDLLINESSIKVASFNVLNYFNGDGQGGGFPTPRGANNLEEFNRQSAKIIAAIAEMNADIIGLMELENDGFDSDSAIANLVNGINQLTGKNYQFVQPTENLVGNDAITVGIIYDNNTVTESGRAVSLATGAFADRNRQPIAQTFRSNLSNGELTVVVNHFKSKGSCPSDATDPNADQQDGQGCWNPLRTQAAVELNHWLESNPTKATFTVDKLIIGDLNAYTKEDPVTTLEAQGYTNLLTQFVGDSHYSYVFYGQAGALDHALANAELTAQVADVVEWHINADEPRVLDYNLEYKSTAQQTSLYNADPYRASDHDPVIVAINLQPEVDVNFDKKVNVKDIVAVAKNLHKPINAATQRFDLNQDNKIDFRDLRQVIRAVFNYRFK